MLVSSAENLADLFGFSKIFLAHNPKFLLSENDNFLGHNLTTKQSSLTSLVWPQTSLTLLPSCPLIYSQNFVSIVSQ